MPSRPLVSSQRPGLIGMVALGAKETDEAYSTKEVTALSALAVTASVSAENVLMFDALQKRVEELDQEREFSAALARDINAAQETVRARISKDIHDTVLQELGVALRLLTRLRDRLQQALGALEDSEIALERFGDPPSTEEEVSVPVSTRSEVQHMLDECQAILESLLGEGSNDLVAWEPDTPDTQRPAAEHSARQCDDSYDINGKYVVEDILCLVRSTNQRLREICTNLHPSYLDAPLGKTLSRSVQRLGQFSHDVKIDAIVSGQEPADLGGNVKDVCRRIMEQAVYNALCHGSPSHIRVELIFAAPSAGSRPQTTVLLCVADDGSGFEPRTARYWRETQHRGLANM